MDYFSYSYTHPGHKRKVNEDSFYTCGLYVLDGHKMVTLLVL